MLLVLIFPLTVDYTCTEILGRNMHGSQPRIIKKYPNRRLYDTTISSYITLDDVRRLVVEQVPLKVIDARSQEDITHNTLLQIIIEREENGPPLFTTEVLTQMIRFYGGNMQELFSKMLVQGLDVLAGKEPLQVLTDVTQKNLENWQHLQQQWFKSFSSQVVKATDPQDEVEETTL